MLDLIPILSACSTTLESLSLEIYEVYQQAEGSDSEHGPPSSVCLSALRKTRYNFKYLYLQRPSLEYSLMDPG